MADAPIPTIRAPHDASPGLIANNGRCAAGARVLITGHTATVRATERELHCDEARKRLAKFAYTGTVELCPTSHPVRQKKASLARLGCLHSKHGTLEGTAVADN